MNYEHTEALIKLLNGALAAYMWTYLIPIAAPKRKMRRARTVYARHGVHPDKAEGIEGDRLCGRLPDGHLPHGA